MSHTQWSRQWQWNCCFFSCSRWWIRDKMEITKSSKPKKASDVNHCTLHLPNLFQWWPATAAETKNWASRSMLLMWNDGRWRRVGFFTCKSPESLRSVRLRPKWNEFLPRKVISDSRPQHTTLGVGGRQAYNSRHTPLASVVKCVSSLSVDTTPDPQDDEDGIN